MADELDKDAEFGGKHKDEEDPILVAQRYLNIYHQIHIFNKERQNEFDDSLLSLSSDIRILLSTLPGGSLLLDHIAELEETRGIVSLMSQIDEKNATKKSKSSKKKNQEQIAQEEIQQPIIENAEITPSNTNNSGPDISAAVLKMLKQSEEKHERDIKALTEAFLQSQENMANVLKEVLVETRNQPAPAPQPINTFSPRPAFERNFTAQETPSYLQPLPEDENPVIENTVPAAKPKLFSFTKKLFSSHKTLASSSARETPRPLNPFVDNTPVSLDDVESSPVDLENETTDNIQTNNPFTSQQEVEEQPNTENPSTEDEWDWEYVDETPAKDNQELSKKEEEQPKSENSKEEEQPKSEHSEEEDEWEYVEVPEDDDVKLEAAPEETSSEEIEQKDKEETAVSEETPETTSEEDIPLSEENLYQDEKPVEEPVEEPQAFEDSAFLYNEVPEYEAEPESYQGPVFYNQDQADEYISERTDTATSDDDQTPQYPILDDESSQWAYDNGENIDEQEFQNSLDDEYADGYIADNDTPFVYNNNEEKNALDETALSPDEVSSYNATPTEDISSQQDALNEEEDSQSSDNADLDRFLTDFANAENGEDEETTKKGKKSKNKRKKTTGE